MNSFQFIVLSRKSEMDDKMATKLWARWEQPQVIFSRKKNTRELYIQVMKKISCPKCGGEAVGGDGFWGTSKPYCSFCGWNVELAKEIERKTLRQLPWGLVLFGAFFGCIAYFSKTEFALFPFLFLSVAIVVSTIASWKRLRLLDESHPAAAYRTSLSSLATAEEKTKQNLLTAYQKLWAINKPRQVRFKTVARVISIAFPISLFVMAYFGFLILRSGSVVFSDIAVPIAVGLVWSIIGITTIRDALRDRKLLAEGDLAIGRVTHQELSGGKNRRSKIRYEFKDLTGRIIKGEATDDLRGLYEDMETPIFYNPSDPSENVVLAACSCELKNV